MYTCVCDVIAELSRTRSESFKERARARVIDGATSDVARLVY